LILLAIIAAFLWMHRAALADFWQRLLAWLAGHSPTQTPETTAPKLAVQAILPPRSFASFANPLLKGTNPRQAVVETFQATEAWYREQGQPRRADETPHEYCLRLKTVNAAERHAISRLTEAYNRIVYGGGGAGPRDLQTVKEVWQSFTPRARGEVTDAAAR
jgi:hypothetical protein